VRNARGDTAPVARPADVISLLADLLMLDGETIAARIFARRRPMQSPGLWPNG